METTATALMNNTTAANSQYQQQEIYTDEEFQEIKDMMFRSKVRNTLKSIFSIYNKKRELLLDDLVSKMVANNLSDGQPKTPTSGNQNEKLMLEKLAAEEFVEFINKLMAELDEISYDLIDLLYCEDPGNETKLKHAEIYEEILDMSRRDFYRKKWRAELKMYQKIRKNYHFLKNWH